MRLLGPPKHTRNGGFTFMNGIFLRGRCLVPAAAPGSSVNCADQLYVNQRRRLVRDSYTTEFTGEAAAVARVDYIACCSLCKPHCITKFLFLSPKLRTTLIFVELFSPAASRLPQRWHCMPVAIGYALEKSGNHGYHPCIARALCAQAIKTDYNTWPTYCIIIQKQTIT